MRARRRQRRIAKYTGRPQPAAAIEVLHRDSKFPTLVAFAGMRQNYMMSTPEFGGILSKLNVNVIFVRDHQRSWYLNGLSGVQGAEDPPGVAHVLRSLIPRGSEFRGTVGMSAGGFGAILVGQLMAAPTALSFSGRTLISEEAVRIREAVDIEFKPPPLDSPWRDLRPLVVSRPGMKVQIHVGAENLADVAEAERLEDLESVSVTRHPTDEHTTARWLKDKNQLVGVLTDSFSLS